MWLGASRVAKVVSVSVARHERASLKRCVSSLFGRLVERGRLDNARDSLLLIRRGKDGYTPDDDIHILETAYAHERANAHSATWASCFRGQALRRTQIVVGIQCLQQGQGISFMANYLVVFLLQLGVTNVYALSVGSEFCTALLLLLLLLNEM